jgi:hypothetical protein
LTNPTRFSTHLGGKLPERRRPGRLPFELRPVVIRFHVVGRHHPRHATDPLAHTEQPPNQCLQLRVSRELHDHEPAVLEASGEENARLLLQVWRQKGKLPNLTPIHLQEFARQAFEPDQCVGGSALDGFSDLIPNGLEHAARSGVWVYSGSPSRANSSIRRIGVPRVTQVSIAPRHGST